MRGMGGGLVGFLYRYVIARIPLPPPSGTPSPRGKARAGWKTDDGGGVMPLPYGQRH